MYSEPYAQRAAWAVHYPLGSEEQDGIMPEASQSVVVTGLLMFLCGFTGAEEGLFTPTGSH